MTERRPSGNSAASGRDPDRLTNAWEGFAAQNSAGGLSQLSTLSSDAYATGQALTALRECGVVRVASETYQRGIRFLLDTQLEDGSWFARTRTLPLQRHFDSEFPHGRDQFISAAASNWAVIALAPASR